ncbi:DUF3219 family protein [Heyndrickxia oleronia]|uniref:DUF3219 family protein n=1 Tax=Heyndrickxia TaxID=2837504 RepID=UPI00203F11E7|nr:DUF3219 family protein [Heyndrickxia oleronia]
MKVEINNVVFNASVDVLDIDNKNVKVEFQTIGSNEYHLYSGLLSSNSLNVVIDELGLDFKARVRNYSRSYQDKLEENTLAKFSFELFEEKEEEWNTLAGVGITAMKNWTRTRAISELLIEKGYFSNDEYKSKLKEVTSRDSEEMLRYIKTGK